MKLLKQSEKCIVSRGWEGREEEGGEIKERGERNKRNVTGLHEERAWQCVQRPKEGSPFDVLDGGREGGSVAKV